MISETAKLTSLQRQEKEARRMWPLWPWIGSKVAQLLDSRAYTGLGRLHRGAFDPNSGAYTQYSHSLPLPGQTSPYEMSQQVKELADQAGSPELPGTHLMEGEN